MTTTWVTTAELAEELRLPVKTLHVWHAKGYGPVAAKIGRHLRYRREDIDRWTREQADKQ